MRLFLFRPRIRHPFFPELATTPAAKARGRVTALTGTFGELARAAAAGVAARRAVYVFSRANGFLSAGERDELWRLFQVPVYALLADRTGRIVAWECEAQHGLHVEEGSGAGVGTRDAGPCPCGRPGPRVMVPARAANAAD